MNIDTGMNVPAAALSSAAATGAAGLLGVGGAAGEQQDRFLKLLITQLKNQDPLNPLDNAQMTTQIAQMSSLEGIQKLNTTLEKLATSLTGNQAMQAASLVGRDVMLPGGQLQLVDGRAVGGVELAQAADNVEVTITDASGAVIHRVDLGALAQGVAQIDWDGVTDNGAAANPGAYQFTVAAKALGKPVDAQTLMVGHVHGVTAAKEGTNLDLGAQGSVSLAQVKRFL